MYYYSGHWIQYQSCTHCAPSQLPWDWGAFWPAAILEALTCQFKLQINSASFRIPIYTAGNVWRASSVDKVSIGEGQKSAAGIKLGS